MSTETNEPLSSQFTSTEVRLVNIPELDKAVHARNAQKCRQILSALKLGTILAERGAVMRLVKPTKTEKTAMEKSLREEREYAIIQVDDQTKIIPGDKHDLDPELIKSALEELGAKDASKSSSSHTHWDNKLHPLPSFGDLISTHKLRKIYPGCEIRIVYNIRNGLPGGLGRITRALRYLGPKS